MSMDAEKRPWQLSRRDFLVIAGQGMVALAVLPACNGDDKDDDGRDAGPDIGSDPDVHDLAPVVEAYFGGADMGSVRAIGTAWIDRLAAGGQALQAEFDQLVELVGDWSTADEVVPRVEARVVDDFANLRISDLHGWQLAQTELRLCGLAAGLLV